MSQYKWQIEKKNTQKVETVGRKYESVCKDYLGGNWRSIAMSGKCWQRLLQTVMVHCGL
jgi:hypothetical protein